MNEEVKLEPTQKLGNVSVSQYIWCHIIHKKKRWSTLLLYFHNCAKVLRYPDIYNGPWVFIQVIHMYILDAG